MKTLLACLLIFTTVSIGQKRILVSPRGDAIPLTNKQSASKLVRMETLRILSGATCPNKATYGHTPARFGDPDINFYGFHKDVNAMWFVAPAGGTIDSVFWWSFGVGVPDDNLVLRLMESNIFPGVGPGYDGYPAPGATTCWGYYPNEGDLDQGISPFADAPSGAWVSTVSGSAPSFPPMGIELWGYGGVPVHTDSNRLNGFDLGVLERPNVGLGDPFFVTLINDAPHAGSGEPWTSFAGLLYDDPMASSLWKFYEHGANCIGWVARGELNLFIWYSMTITTNTAPTIEFVADLGNTLAGC